MTGEILKAWVYRCDLLCVPIHVQCRSMQYIFCSKYQRLQLSTIWKDSTSRLVSNNQPTLMQNSLMVSIHCQQFVDCSTNSFKNLAPISSTNCTKSTKSNQLLNESHEEHTSLNVWCFNAFAFVMCLFLLKSMELISQSRRLLVEYFYLKFEKPMFCKYIQHTHA